MLFGLRQPPGRKGIPTLVPDPSRFDDRPGTLQQGCSFVAADSCKEGSREGGEQSWLVAISEGRAGTGPPFMIETAILRARRSSMEFLAVAAQ